MEQLMDKKSKLALQKLHRKEEELIKLVEYYTESINEKLHEASILGQMLEKKSFLFEAKQLRTLLNRVEEKLLSTRIEIEFLKATINNVLDELLEHHTIVEVIESHVNEENESNTLDISCFKQEYIDIYVRTQVRNKVYHKGVRA